MITKDKILFIIDKARVFLNDIEQYLEDGVPYPDSRVPSERIEAVDDPIQTVPDVEVIDGNTVPWVQALREKEGWSEIDHEEELTAWLGHNPNDDDADGRAWCASGLNAALRDAGINGTGSMAANSFATFGYECEEKNGAILVFQPKQGKRKVSHVCVKVNDEKALGANQGDAIKESNLAWYKANAELVAVRCPDGFELV